LADDFAGLCEPDKYQVQPGQAWRRIKGSRNLRGVQLAVLRALAAWREQRASASNRPRKWIIGDDVLLDLARSMPGDKERFQLIRGLEPGLIKRHGDTLLELIATARTEPPEHWPSPSPRLQLSPEQEALVEAMLAVVRLRGSQKGVSPQTLASRKDLERLVAGDPDIPLLQGWRAALAGQEVQALLQGRLRLEVNEGELRTVPTA
jgi:ribonuclease D